MNLVPGKRWSLIFSWTTHHADKLGLGGLFTDLWAVVLTFLDLKALRAICQAHPLFYKIISTTKAFRDQFLLASFSSTHSSVSPDEPKDPFSAPHTSLLPPNTSYFEFSKEGRKVQFSFHDRERQMINLHSTASCLEYCTALVANPTPEGNGQTVDFKLHAEFFRREPDYFISYFNFSACSITPKLLKTLPKPPLSCMYTHYFADGDLWDCTYSYAKRREATWNKGDIISVRVGKLSPAAYQNLSCTHLMKHPNLLSNFDVHIPPEGPFPAVTISEKEHSEGYTAYIAFFKNYKMVHDPVLISGFGSLWICCKLADVKDCIEIVKPEQEVHLPMIQEGQDQIVPTIRDTRT